MTEYSPIIIIGAARSGTKLLRDLIADHPLVDKVPYDINYIWRLGNEGLPHDEIPIELLTPSIVARIQNKFAEYHQGAPFLIEKTVSNCLRVPFVDAVFPDARYIHLVRNGEDAIESVLRQWIAPPDWNYLIGKAKTFPILDAFQYATDYAGRLLARMVNHHARKSQTWGPRYMGIDDDLRNKDLIEVCAIQWARCVEKAAQGLASLRDDRVLVVFYEDLVASPQSKLTEISNFLQIDPSPYLRSNLLKDVTTANVGRGAHSLTKEQHQTITGIIAKITPVFGKKMEYSPSSNADLL